MKPRAHSIDEIVKRLGDPGLRERAAGSSWALCPRGTVFPYFCAFMPGDGGAVEARFMMLEGWQTFHDFLRTRADPNFGFYSTPLELAHFELVLCANGDWRLFRHDPCLVPRPVGAAEREFCAKLLWESYGVMLRIESDAKLTLKYADEKAMFARLEKGDGSWTDHALPIVDARPHVESITLAKKDLAQAKDLPFAAEERLCVDFALVPNVMSQDKPPRCVYRLVAFDPSNGETVVSDATTAPADGGLRTMWESVAPRLLRHLLARRRIPGEIMVCSQRLFRMLRPLCLELPFKLSLHDELPRRPQS